MDTNSKRIIKNTGFLYIRMLILLFIGLYTSRVILHNLGIEDYGIYNVVGGLTGMFAFFQSSLANATQRFISIELGKESKEGAKKVFSQFIYIYMFFVVMTVLALETIGYWFVANKLTIPPERLQSALIVFHLTVVSLCFTLLGTAFNSVIIAHEDMSFYSYLGIFDGLVKLLVAYLISITTHDRLILYAILLLGAVIVVQSSYAIWCFSKYTECRFQRCFERGTIVNMGKFFSWNFVGTIIYMTKDQMVNVLMNIFFGPIVNAARGISMQVNGVVSQFTNSIFTSVQPQIVKSYSANNREYMNKLIFLSSRYSFMAFWTLALVVSLNINYLLNIWLFEVPVHTASFAIWVLIDSCLVTLTNAPWGAALATGKLRNYTLYGNGSLLLILPVSYLALVLAAPPVAVFVITVAVRVLQVILVVRQANIMVGFGIQNYIQDVISPILLVCITSSVIPLIVYCFTDDNLLGLFARGIVTVLSCIVSIWILGINKFERQYIVGFINDKLG